MKKILVAIFVTLVACSTFYLSYNYRHGIEPNHYYEVYLDDEFLGTVISAKDLEKYIDKRGEYIKNKYNVKKIYKPNGLEIKKTSTYAEEVLTSEQIYNKILDKKDFTIEGYQFTITDGDVVKKVYVLDKNIFEEAVTTLIETYVGEEKYNNFKNDLQKEIETTGSYTNNIYIDENITIKETNIPINEKIFTTSDELAQYLLFGENRVERNYVVQPGDTITKVAFNNKISISEFLLSNPSFTSENNLLFPGQEVVISETAPQLSVVIEETTVEDEADRFETIEVINQEKLVGDDTITQVGEEGLSRVTRNTKKINGVVIYSETDRREVLKPTVDQIIEKGGKVIPHIGSLTSWGWPTNPGWIITDRHAWRINPVTGMREIHSGTDIAGTGYYSPIYASNNGTIEAKKIVNDYGKYVLINHNNGYWTLYAHLADFGPQKVGSVVARGDIIGYMGSTGYSTGVHLHYEMWYGCRWCRIDSLSVY